MLWLEITKVKEYGSKSPYPFLGFGLSFCMHFTCGTDIRSVPVDVDRGNKTSSLKWN